MKTSLSIFSLSLIVSLSAACGGGSSSSTVDPSPTPTNGDVSPTPTPNPQLSCRDFHIHTGPDGNGANNSVYYASALGSGTDASEFLGAGGWNSNGPVTLCAAPPSGNKSAVTLSADVVVAISLPQSNCLCRRYLAAGSTGTFFAAASSDALDVTTSLDSHGSSAGSAPAMTDGSGTAGAGDLRMKFQARDGEISASASACTADACTTATSSGAARELWYTTGTAISQVTNPKQGGTVSISVSGSPFGTNFMDTSVRGTLAGAGEQSEDNAAANGDVATIERIAE